MARNRTTPLAAVGKGLAAGLAGTVVMTGYQTAVMKARDSGASTIPAEVGKRVLEGVFRRQVPEERMELINNGMHFLYGTSWGALYGLLHSSTRMPTPRHGLLFGTLVWAASLVELPALKLAPPVWQYPPKEIPLDLSYHLVYGTGVAGAYAALDR